MKSILPPRIPAARLAAALLAAGFLLACGTAPRPASAGQAPPAWVLDPPEPDERYVYFVGSGQSATMAEGEEAARGGLIDEIMRYLGVRISSETTATARATLESYQTDVVQTLRSTSAGRVAGLEIAERWVSQREGRVGVYLLARYNKAELAKEKRRLEELFREQLEAVSGPEAEGRALEGRGELYQAALRYLEAAAAASRSELENADIRFQRNMNQAREAVRRIGLVKLNDNLKVYAGQEFPAFLLKVVAGSAASDRGIAGAPLRVSYREQRAAGRSLTRSQQAKSGADGSLSFQPPPPEFVGAETLTMALDLSEALQPLEQVPDRLYPQVEALQELARGKSVRFAYQSLSLAGTIPTGIAVFDLDATGNPITLSETSAGLLSELGQAGFKVVALPVGAAEVAGRPDSKVIAELSAGYGGQVERVIFGTARIAETVQEGQTLIIQVSGTVKVVELASGKVLLTLNRSKRAQGSSGSAALATAFKKLGEDLGQAIADQLR